MPATSGRTPSREAVRHSFSFLLSNIILTLIPEIDLTAIARTSSAVSTASPVSPLRDGHENKQILVHVSLDYSPKISPLITLALSQSV